MTSCESFLEEQSQGLFIPRTADDYSELLIGEALNHGTKNGIVIGEFLDLLTDDVEDNVNPRRRDALDEREAYWGYFTWQQDPEVDINHTVQHDKLWEVAYHRIFIANIIIDKMSEIAGDKSKKQQLEAEARFIRAWSYFWLINTYADPYENPQQAAQTPGVPINDATSVENVRRSRSPLAEVYQHIEEDLIQAITLFDEAKQPISRVRPNLYAAQLLMSRVALYTKKYADAAQWSSQLIEHSGLELHSLEDYVASSNLRFIDGRNKEILFMHGSKERYRLDNIVSASRTSKGNYKVSLDLLKLYGNNDKRKDSFFRKVSNNLYKPFKFYESGSKDALPYVFHLSEAYLNRAEAYAELGNYANAAADLNALRAKRIQMYEPQESLDGISILNEIKLERRMELCFEGHRWFDLRRWGRPELKHTYSSNTNASEKQEFVLQQKDGRYTLPIPQAERSQNNNL